MDFLSSFNLGADSSATPSSAPCKSLEELQERLKALLADKASASRAEHMAITFEIGPSARFTLSHPPSAPRAPDDTNQFTMSAPLDLENIDPSLSGLQHSSANGENGREDANSDFTANDALMEQAEAEPVLQQAAARDVIAAVSATDDSSWVLREMSRSPQTCTFIYLCQHSAQQWDRQNKGKVDVVICDYTLKEMDPILMNRPAFDCRGTTRITFSKGSRNVLIKYDHTPFHKSVAEVAELFRPPPRPTLLKKSNKAEKQKTPKKSASARKKRESTQALDEDGNPKPKKRSQALDENGKPKKRSKRASQAESQTAAAADQQLANNREAPLCDGQVPPDAPLDAPPKASLNAPSDAPAPVVAEGTAPVAPAAPESKQPATVSNVPLNLSPEEAARRREAANKLLTEAGVEPSTLSTEQFNIFANQSPDLQKESLVMLAKYGAERLRIVHPSNRDASASMPPTPDTQSSSTGPARTTTELAPRANGLEGEAETTLTKSRGKRKSGTGKSRTACAQCRSQRIRCPKERPVCAECQKSGAVCEYAPVKPRKRKSLANVATPTEKEATEENGPLGLALSPESNAYSAQEPTQTNTHQTADEEAMAKDETEHEQVQDDTSLREEGDSEVRPAQTSGEAAVGEEHDYSSYSSYPQIPVSDMLTRNVDHNHEAEPVHQSELPYYQAATRTAQAQPEEPPISQPQAQAFSSSLALPQGSVHYPPHQVSRSSDFPSSHQRTGEVSPPLQFSTQTQLVPQTTHDTQSNPPSVTLPGWSRGADSSSHASASSTIPSPRPQQSETASQASEAWASQAHTRVQDVVALSQAALEQHRLFQTPSMATPSDGRADDLRTKSRETPRAQSRTPRGTPSSGRPYQVPPPAEPPTMDSQVGNGRAAALNLNHTSSYSRHSGGLSNASSASERSGYEPYPYQRSNTGAASGSAYNNYHRNASSETPTTVPIAAHTYAANNIDLPDSLSAPRGGHYALNRSASSYRTPNSSQSASRRSGQMSAASSAELNLRTASRSGRSEHGTGSGGSHAHRSQRHQQHQHQQHHTPYGHHQQHQQIQQHQQSQHHRQNQSQYYRQPQQLQHDTQQRHRLPAHSQQQSAQSVQGQNWYGFNEGNNNSFNFSSQRHNLGWKMSEEPWGGVS